MSVCTNSNRVQSNELIANRRKVADLLLSIGSSEELRRYFSQSEMAITLGTSRDLVNNSLVSLEEESAIKIDRPKVLINKAVLERILKKQI